MSTGRLALLLLVLLLVDLLTVLASPVNVTIDDTQGDPRTGIDIAYEPADRWNVGQNCPGCEALVDASKAYLNSWHDTTWHPPNDTLLQVKTPFRGSAVYVYGILELDVSNSDLYTSDITFFIDNERVGHFTQYFVSGQTGQQYNALLYANDSLAFDDHLLTIQVGGTTGQRSILELDYIQYTFDDQTNSLPSTSSENLVNPTSTTSPSTKASDQTPTSSPFLPSLSSSSSSTSTIIDIPTLASSPSTLLTSTLDTTPKPSSNSAVNTTTSTSHTPVIVASVCSVVGAALIAAVVIFLCRSRRKLQRDDPSAAPLSLSSEESLFSTSARTVSGTIPIESESTAPPRNTRSKLERPQLYSINTSASPTTSTRSDLNRKLSLVSRTVETPLPQVAMTGTIDRDMALSLVAENERLRALLSEQQPPPYLPPESST